MKTINLIIGVCILFSSVACSQEFNKLKDSEADQNKIKIARDFAFGFFNTVKNGETYLFQDEAVDVIKNQLTPENQKVVYQQLKNEFGDFQSLEYAETWIQGGNKTVQVVRLKGDFDKSNRKLEIRVVVNERDKIAGFFIKPWSDMLT